MVLAAACCAALWCGAASAQVKGLSSSHTPYILPVAPGVETISLLTVGDRPGTPAQFLVNYRMAGNPDGLATLDNGDGTFTLYLNHELDASEGAPRSHLRKGAFMSVYTIDAATLQVVNGRGFNQGGTTINLWSAPLRRYLAPTTTVYDEFCSMDLAPTSAYAFEDLGTTTRILLNAEESSEGGRPFAHILTGPDAGTSWELPHLGRMRRENALANPFPQAQTIVANTDDNPSEGGQVYFYIGQKQSTGNDVQKAGLLGGRLYGVAIPGLDFESRDAPPAPGTRFSLADLGDVAGLAGPTLDVRSDDNHVTRFLGPEDGSWDPLDPTVFYFNTTDRYDQVKDGAGTQVGRSRLWRIKFDDITNPLSGGTIEALLDGSETGPGGIPGPNQLDNLGVTVSPHGVTRLLLQEDASAQAHNSRVWLYDTQTDALTLLAEHDPARFGRVGLAPTLPFNNDEESSGIIDASSVLGPGWFLLTSMTHHETGGELVWGGQLLAMYVPQALAVPEPSSLALAALAGLVGTAAAQRRRSARRRSTPRQ